MGPALAGGCSQIGTWVTWICGGFITSVKLLFAGYVAAGWWQQVWGGPTGAEGTIVRRKETVELKKGDQLMVVLSLCYLHISVCSDSNIIGLQGDSTSWDTN